VVQRAELPEALAEDAGNLFESSDRRRVGILGWPAVDGMQAAQAARELGATEVSLGRVGFSEDRGNGFTLEERELPLVGDVGGLEGVGAYDQGDPRGAKDGILNLGREGIPLLGMEARSNQTLSPALMR
jgi:hypothetical protein